MTFSGNFVMDSSLMSRVMILRVFDRSDNPKFGTRTYLWLSDWASCQFPGRYGGLRRHEQDLDHAHGKLLGGLVCLGADGRAEPVRLDDQQVAGQVLESAFGRRADEQPFPAVP